MNLSKTYIQVPSWKRTSSIQMTLDNDFNVSDSKSDIERIVQEKGKLNVQEIKPMDDKCLVRGTLDFGILYIGDDGSGQLQSMEGEIRFEEVVNMDGLRETDTVWIRWDLEDLRAGLINSRKVNLRSIVVLHFEGRRVEEEEVAIALEQEPGRWTQNKQLPLTMLYLQGKDQIRVKEEMTIPANRPNMMSIIWHQENMDHLDVKLQDGYVLIRGQMSLFVLYRDEMMDNTVNDVELNVPFEGRMEMIDVRQEMIPDVKVRLDQVKLDIRNDSDGEARILGIEAILVTENRIYREEVLNLLKDIYAPDRTYLPEKKMVNIEHLALKNKSQCPVRERVKLKRDLARMLQICHTKADVKIDQMEVTEEGIDVEGVVSLQILYISSDDHKPVNSAKAMVPFNYTIEAGSISKKDVFDVYPSVEQLNVTMTDSDEIEVKMVISLDATIFKIVSVEVVSQVLEEALDYKKIEAMPGMIGHMVGSEDTLWALAKQYYASPEDIREMNGLDGDKLPVGESILIMKNMEIFK